MIGFAQRDLMMKIHYRVVTRLFFYGAVEGMIRITNLVLCCVYRVKDTNYYNESRVSMSEYSFFWTSFQLKTQFLILVVVV